MMKTEDLLFWGIVGYLVYKALKTPLIPYIPSTSSNPMLTFQPTTPCPVGQGQFTVYDVGTETFSTECQPLATGL